MSLGGKSDAATTERLMRRWKLDPGAIEGLDVLLDRTRRTYARVEALAADLCPVPAVTAPWEIERVAGSDRYHAWMHRVTPQGPASDGPLSGLRLVVKDSIAVAGVPMTAGSAFLRDYVPAQSAVAVSRALAAGATLAGTAVCEDLCYSGSSFTSVTGPVLNPYDPERAAGGSTSGCGVLLATGEADLALGTDLGGSVRNPAAWCGITALKPTFGLVPYAGALPTEFSMDHLGLMARTAQEIALLLEAVAGPSPADPRQAGIRALPDDVSEDISGLRVGIVTDGFGWPDRSDPRVDACARDAALKLADQCAGVRDVTIDLHRHARDIHVPLSCEGGFATVFEQNMQGSNHGGAYDPELALAWGRALDENAEDLPLNGKVSLIAGTLMRHETKGRIMALAQRLRGLLRTQYDAALSECDILVMPTCPMLPHRLPKGPLTPAEHQNLAFEMHDNNCATNLTGHPALSMPCGLIDGLPVGMLLIGRHMDDRLLLRVAREFQERVFPPPAPPGFAHDGRA